MASADTDRSPAEVRTVVGKKCDLETGTAETEFGEPHTAVGHSPTPITLPKSKSVFATRLQNRKYFDSGDYNASSDRGVERVRTACKMKHVMGPSDIVPHKPQKHSPIAKPDEDPTANLQPTVGM